MAKGPPGLTGPVRVAKPSRADKQATIYAAKQNLKPWEVPPPAPPSQGKQPPPVLPATGPGRRSVVYKRPTVSPPPTPRQVKANEDLQYKAALAAPINAHIRDGSGKLKPARQVLARSMTNQERADYHKALLPPPPAPHHGLFHLEGQLLHELGTGAHLAKTVGGSLVNAAISPVERAIRPYVQQAENTPAWHPSKKFQAAVGAGSAGLVAGAGEAGHIAADVGFGPNLVKMAKGQAFSPGGAAFEALTVLPAGKAIRISRALAEGAFAARGITDAAERAAAFQRAYDAVMKEPGIARKTILAARRSTALNVPERQQLNQMLEAGAMTKAEARLAKDQVDAQVYTHTKDIPTKAARRAAISETYQHLIDNLPENGRVPWSTAIKHNIGHLEPGQQISVHLNDNLLGPHAINGTLDQIGGNNLKFTEHLDENTTLQHSVPYGRIFHAGPLEEPAPHGLTIPSRAEALANLGAPEIGGQVSHEIAADALRSGVELPDRLRNPSELAAAVERVFQLAREGYAWKDWYPRAAASAEEVFRHYDQIAPGKVNRSAVAQLMAIFSTGNDPTPNMKHVVDAIDQYLEKGRVVKAGLFPKRQSAEAMAALKGAGWDGRKRNSFYANMLRHLDPAAYAKLQKELGRKGAPVTVDLWVMRMFAPWLGKDVPGGFYDGFEQLITKMAQQQGMDPEELQAAAWVGAKARGLIGSEIRRGASTGTMRRATTWERAFQRAGDAYETGVRKYLGREVRAGEPAGAGALRPEVGDGGAELAGGGRLGGGGGPSGPVGAPPPLFTEVTGSRVGTRQFIDAVRANPHLWSVSVPTNAELRDARVFLREDGQAGYAIRSDGELFAVFRNGGTGGHAYESALRGAHQGAYWLNVWDIPKIAHSYEEAGFVPVARVPFNPKHAPPGIPETVGQPDVVFMAFGARPHPMRVFDEYDKAVNYTRELADPAAPKGALGRPGFEISAPAIQQLEAHRESLRSILGDAGRRLVSEESGQFSPAEFLRNPFRRPRLPEPPPVAPERPSWHLPDPKPGQSAQERTTELIRAGLSPADAHRLRSSEANLRIWEERAAKGVPGAEARLAQRQTAHEAFHARLEEKSVPLDAQVAGRLHGMKTQRGRVEAGYTLARKQRIAAAQEAGAKQADPIDALHAELAAHRGPFPTLEYKGFTHFSPEALRQLVADAKQAETDGKITYYQSLRLRKALERAYERKMPTNSEIGLMDVVFGHALSNQIVTGIEDMHPLKSALLNIGGIPRALQTSYDLSAPFRQGLVAGASHPVLFARNIGPMLKGASSKEGYDAIMQGIHEQPHYEEMLKHGVAITDVGKHMSEREEMFVSQWAEHIPGVKFSSRGYTAFLNKMRSDLWEKLSPEVQQAAEAAGRDSEKALDDLAKVINGSTGRGGLGRWEKNALGLSQVLFSPRLLASRLQYLNPYWYYKLDPAARMEAMRGMASLLGSASTILYLAKMGGAQVNLNPLNADFGKIRVGDTRVDILGGFLPIVRQFAQIAAGKRVSSVTGQTMNLTGGFGKSSRGEVAISAVRSKLAPIPGLVSDLAFAKTVTGQPIRWQDQWQRISPLAWQDASDLFKSLGGNYFDPSTWEHAAPGALAALAATGTGFGIQTYKGKTPKQRGAGMSSGGGGLGGGLGGGSLGGSLGGGFGP